MTVWNINSRPWGIPSGSNLTHDDVIKWKHFPSYWPFVRGIHRSPLNSPQKGLWRRALMFSLICARINGWVNNGEAGDLKRHRANCDVIVMLSSTRTRSYLCPDTLRRKLITSQSIDYTEIVRPSHRVRIINPCDIWRSRNEILKPTAHMKGYETSKITWSTYLL